MVDGIKMTGSDKRNGCCADCEADISPGNCILTSKQIFSRPVVLITQQGMLSNKRKYTNNRFNRSGRCEMWSPLDCWRSYANILPSIIGERDSLVIIRLTKLFTAPVIWQIKVK